MRTHAHPFSCGALSSPSAVHRPMSTRAAPHARVEFVGCVQLSGGLDAQVMAHVNLRTKRLFGKGAVAIAGFREWFRYRFPRFALEIDGKALDEKTPLAWKTKPGARHEIQVTLTGYQPFRDTVLVPEGGGDVKVLAFLPPRTVKLRVTSTPAGADVYLNGALKGRTPIELSDLAPASATAPGNASRVWVGPPSSSNWLPSSGAASTTVGS